MRLRNYFVYIITNIHLTLYIGITNDLTRRVFEHKHGFVEGFTKKYGLTKLIYYEEYSDIKMALNRERQLKYWNREWKLDLIRNINPTFKDLYPELVG